MASMCHLPDEALASIAGYLPSKMSLAFFAAAMTPRPSSASRRRRPSSSADAIVLCSSERWEELNFFHIDANVSMRLTDVDLYAILMAIDAANRLKRLKLTGCFNINGSGLWPLTGSRVIEQIDLDVAKRPAHVGPASELEPLISESTTLPILERIVEKDWSSLQHLQFPQSWILGGTASSALYHFLARYSRLLDSRPFDCMGCARREDTFSHVEGDEDCSCWAPKEGENWFAPSGYFSFAGSGPIASCSPSQNFTCYSCLRNCCDNDYENNFRLRVCTACYKRYCESCGFLDKCCGVVDKCWECQIGCMMPG